MDDLFKSVSTFIDDNGITEVESPPQSAEIAS